MAQTNTAAVSLGVRAVSAPPLDFSRFAGPAQAHEDGFAEDADLAALEPVLLECARRIFDRSPPSFPWFASQVMETVQDPAATREDLTRVVARDPVIVIQVIRAANAARYAGNPVSDLSNALDRVGRTAVAAIAAMASSSAILSPTLGDVRVIYGDVWRHIWLHAMACSATASWLASHLGGVEPGTASLAALIHDVGQMIGMRAVASGIADGNLPVLSPFRTRELLHRTHARIGVLSGEICHFPKELMAVCRDHNSDLEGSDARITNMVRLVSSVDDVQTGYFYDHTVRDGAESATALRLDQGLLDSIAKRLRDARVRSEPLLGAP